MQVKAVGVDQYSQAFRQGEPACLPGIMGEGHVAEELRFVNQPYQQVGRWVWDVPALEQSVNEGLRRAVQSGIQSWGIDTWDVDYGVVRDGQLVGPVACYRDPRHAAGVPFVDAAIGWDELYSITGVQFMPFNTIYQLAAAAQSLVDGGTFLMVPDLLASWATGVVPSDRPGGAAADRGGDARYCQRLSGSPDHGSQLRPRAVTRYVGSHRGRGSRGRANCASASH